MQSKQTEWLHEISFEHFFQENPIAMYMTAELDSLILVNQAMADFVGYSMDELNVMTFREFVHQIFYVDEQQPFLENIESDNVFQFQQRLVCHDQTIVWGSLYYRKMPVTSLYSTPHYVTTVYNITERKSVDQRYQMISELVSIMPIR